MVRKVNLPAFQIPTINDLRVGRENLLDQLQVTLLGSLEQLRLSLGPRDEWDDGPGRPDRRRR